MMDAIELLKNMQENCLRGGKYDDPLRMDKFKALSEAIKALENQSKYEKALIKYKCMNCNLDARVCRGKACDNAIKNTFKLAGLEVSP